MVPDGVKTPYYVKNLADQAMINRGLLPDFSPKRLLNWTYFKNRRHKLMDS